VKLDGGGMKLTSSSRIVTKDDKLAPLAKVFQTEISNVAGLNLQIASGEGKAGDIVIGFDTAQRMGGYALVVSDKAVIGAADYKGAAAGTATILQALQVKGEDVKLPGMTIVDYPNADYCGAMIDVARRETPLEVIRDCVDACRLYKIRYFHLHMTDDQSWTFPSTKYPQLGGGRRYNLQGLRDLVAYADARGVTIVPEIEMPGHCGAAVGGMPEVFGAKDPKTGTYVGLGVMNITNEQVYVVMKDVLTEVSQVFASSPYIHLGGDETWFGLLEGNADCRAAMKKMGMNTPQLFCHFLGRMSEHVKSLGKRAIVWEGFERGGSVPKHTIVMAWRNWYYRADHLLEDGYTIINCPWWLGCDWDDWNMYMSNFIWLKKSDRVLGATSVYWEQPAETNLPTLRNDRLPLRNERTWNVDTRRKIGDLKKRLAHTDKVLDKMLSRFTFEAKGITAPGSTSFDKSLSLEFLPSAGGDVIRYTLDGSEPTASSPACNGAIRLTDTTTVKARSFSAANAPQAVTWTRTFEFQPFSVQADGLISKEFGTRFAKSVAVSVKPAVSGGTVRYTLDGGEPTDKSPAYGKPITFDKSTTVKARWFDAAGNAHGYTYACGYTKVDYEKNLTTGKPAKASSTGWQEKVEYAFDGLVEVMDFESTFWGSGPAPQWLEVDLEKTRVLGEIDLYTFFGDGRYYQYVIEVSTDEKNWIQVADGSANTAPATAKGYRHAITPTKARYIRTTMLKNSANQGLHIVELRAYEAK
jgi:hexosaminidase